MVPEELRQAADHLRAGQHLAARKVLVRYLQRDPNSDIAWFLLSFAFADRAHKVDCLRRAVQINPANERARVRLQQLTAPAAGVPTARLPKTPPFVSGTVLEERRGLKGRAQSPSGQAPRRIVRPTQKRDTGFPGLILALGVIFVCLFSIGGLALAYTLWQARLESLAFAQATSQARVAAAAATSGGSLSLPAAWTPSFTPTMSATPTPQPTRTATPTATFPSPNPTMQAEMDEIQREVSDLRGFPAQRGVPTFILTTVQVRPILAAMFLSSGGSKEEVDDQAKVLTALGLIKPNYNLYENTLSRLSDSLGGFFDAETKQIYVIGVDFGGVERYVYSHEYNHALVDQYFPLDELDVYPLCLHTEDYCRAVSALVEGDATFLMNQWVRQYATMEDVEEILNYKSPEVFHEDSPPPFAAVDAEFPYVAGRDFVALLHERGSWAEVNQAYLRLPQSSEQILHPEKYLAGEDPLEVPTASLDGVLGEGWRLIDVNTLGEWGTYLILGYGADLEAQLGDDVAAEAAEGWGGDSYQIYYQDAESLTVLAGYWVWDTVGDAEAFERAMEDYQRARFRGASVARADGSCWEGDGQASCTFQSGGEVLWLLAPSQTLLDQLLVFFPHFP